MQYPMKAGIRYFETRFMEDAEEFLSQLDSKITNKYFGQK
jgi:hypothetical protein